MFSKRIFSRLLASVLFTIITVSLTVAQPTGYYNGTEGLTGTALRSALHNIIKNHNSISYSALWSAFNDTDKKSNGTVWDMYSDIPGGTPPYQYTFGSDQCGNYNSEGDCYNREHTWPKSWFNDNSPMYSDLFHLYPTDGYVNGKRSNYPYGEVGSSSWTSLNGSKLGNNSYPGNSEEVFEPIDAYKGDLARTYFYMSTRYYGEDAGWQSNGMVDGADLKTWAQNMLIEWHQNDPVSQKEIDRNNAVYSYQNNRNPFIDHPEFADKIWGDPASSVSTRTRLRVDVSPNPCTNTVEITVPKVQATLQITFFTINGQVVLHQEIANESQAIIDVNGINAGLYLIEVAAEDGIYHGKLIKNQ
ncbi:MAG: endonuclease I [Bacteroidetes bacterium HGW-Bacteroidetes-22]|nr:MAG: endonuclease I [Bacteroidetes bacterium HGW-Bacteroidetes-22]